jgi:7-keto-8-aminopelargonate synthetase-like enzyme/acyl-CoA synthetase (AMP-forming)/AMP-acid ligase II/acyl carrier protein
VRIALNKQTLDVNNCVELVQQHLDADAEKNIVHFLQDGKQVSETLNYAQLDQRARSLAALLQKHAKPGDRVILLYPSSVEFFCALFACFYAGMVAVPVFSLLNKAHAGFLDKIIHDAHPSLVLSCQAIIDNIHSLQQCKLNNVLPFLDDLAQKNTYFYDNKYCPWLITDQFNEDYSEIWQPVNLQADSLALLQYTSGSTGVPKGTMVSHGNFLANVEIINLAFELDPETDSYFSWLPLYHDMGLVSILTAATYAIPLYIMSPERLIKSPAAWLQAISRFRTTISGGPNFAYALCNAKISEKILQELDLSNWRLAYCGAEPINLQVLKGFAKKFSACGFQNSALFPCYGLAEATLFVSGGHISFDKVAYFNRKALKENRAEKIDKQAKDAVAIVSCGKAYQHTIIVNPKDKSYCESGCVGEVWVKSESVAQGYWQKKSVTQEIFHASPQGETTQYLNTGDLGFFFEGELYITGRSKEVIIINGEKYYPYDIEAVVKQCCKKVPLREVVAFSISGEAHEQLILALAANNSAALPEIIQAIHSIREHLYAAQELIIDEIIVIPKGEIKKTTSGKIKRAELKQKFIDQQLSLLHTDKATNFLKQEVAQKNTQKLNLLEQAIIHIISQDINVPAENISSESSFAELGLDSIKVAEIVGQIKQDIDGELNEAVFLCCSNIRELAQVINENHTINPALLNASKQTKDNSQKLTTQQLEFSTSIESFKPYQQFTQYAEQLQQQHVSEIYFNQIEGVSKDTVQIAGEQYVNFSGYNYLGLSGDPRVNQAAIEAIEQYGTSVSASRLVAGERPLHQALEAAITQMLNTEDTITYVSGHATNVTTISSLYGPGDLIVHDELAHNSLIQGAIASGAERLIFRHNDWQNLDELLTQHRDSYAHVLIVIEGLYSMDGDIADVPKFVEIKHKHRAWLMVDEAHSAGVLGKRGNGVVEHFALPRDAIEIYMGTLSKAFASCGGYISGKQALIDFLKYRASGFVYSVGMSPANAAAAH